MALNILSDFVNCLSKSELLHIMVICLSSSKGFIIDALLLAHTRNWFKQVPIHLTKTRINA